MSRVSGRWQIVVFVDGFCFPILLIGQSNCHAADEEKLPLVTDVEFQPLAAQVKRVAQALDLLGSPLTKAEQESLDRTCSATDPTAGIRGIQETLDPLCLAMVEINAASRVKVAA